MGVGYELICNKCGKSYMVLHGRDMRLPEVCEEIVEDIEAGCYEEEWQKLGDGGAQHATPKCPDCGGKLERNEMKILWDRNVLWACVRVSPPSSGRTVPPITSTSP